MSGRGSSLSQETVFRKQSFSFRDIVVALFAAGRSHKLGNVRGGFCDPPQDLRTPHAANPAVFDRPTFPTLVKLGKETHHVLHPIRSRVESQPVVVGDEAGVEVKMVVQAFGKVLSA
jgi:hypothetical protein